MDISTIKEIVLSSNAYKTWSLSIIGASLLVIFSTSYIKLEGKWIKLIYLLFIPGWTYLCFSIYSNDIIARRSIAAMIHPERLDEIFEKINDEFACQISHFTTALIFFATWLLLFLLSWVAKDFITKTKIS